MYKSTMQWRSSYSISEVMDDFGSAGHFGKDGGRITDPAEWTWLPHANTREAELAYRHAFFTRLPRLPHSGELQPVLIWRAGHADYKGIVREELVDIMIKAFVVHLEDALQASRAASFKTGEMVRARLIVDCEGLGMDNIRYIPILKKIITLGKSYYPEVAETVTVIRAPGFCTMFYNLVKPLLPKLLQKKIYLLSQNFHEGLIQHTGLDPKSLPQFLGGDRTDGDFPEVLPVPENALKLFLAGKKGKPLACNSRERTFESYVKFLEEHTSVSLESAAEEFYPQYCEVHSVPALVEELRQAAMIQEISSGISGDRNKRIETVCKVLSRML
eukprot:symbB.v1.2.000304.t1/scaffold6.1/size569917/7